MEDYFRSKVDPWIASVCLAGPLGALGALLAVRSTGKREDLLVTLVLVVAAIGLVVWILLSTIYRFDNPNLIVRSGPFRWTVPVAEITSVTRTRSPRSSPALSFDRLRIEYGSSRREVIISPRDQAGCMAALESRLPASTRRIVKQGIG